VTLDFTAIDFETANSYRGSPCSVGLAKVRNGFVIDELTTLIRPPAPYEYFDGFNTLLHGINAQMVRNAPQWPEALARIMNFAGGDVLVCHNAGFDVGVIRYACIAAQMPWPSVDFLCTLVSARRCYTLASYSLPFVAEECAVVLGRHHQAAGDALCAATIAVAMARFKGVKSLIELAEIVNVRVGHMETGTYKGSIYRRPGHGLINPELNPDADPEHPLYGQVIVFTGTLLAMTRQVAWEEVAKVGGLAERGVTKLTNALVIGDINPAVLAPNTLTTGKAAKALKLLDKGYEIELMTEDDFVRAL
jgi:DNA polymerase III epsilon subunit-like protein